MAKTIPGFSQDEILPGDQRRPFSLKKALPKPSWTYWILLEWGHGLALKLVWTVIPHLAFLFLVHAQGEVVLCISAWLLPGYTAVASASFTWRYCMMLCCDAVAISGNKYYLKGLFFFICPFQELERVPEFIFKLYISNVNICDGSFFFPYYFRNRLYFALHCFWSLLKLVLFLPSVRKWSDVLCLPKAVGFNMRMLALGNDQNVFAELWLCPSSASSDSYLKM